MNGVADWIEVADVELSVPALIRHCASNYADRELCVFDDRRLTYAEADESSALLATRLVAAGLGKGSRVGMVFPNSPEFIIVWLAIVRIGAVAVPISTLSTGAELVSVIRHADLALLVTADRYRTHDYPASLESALDGLAQSRGTLRLLDAPYLREVWVWGPSAPAWATVLDLSPAPDVSCELLAAIETEVSPADPVSIIYTSGSTGAPKGAIHTHNGFMRQAAKLAAIMPYARDDRVFTPMPFFWVGGLTYTVLAAMHIGCTLLGSGSTGGALLDFLERERVTYLTGWPHLLTALETDPSFPQRDLSALRGGNLLAALPPDKRPRNQVFGIALGMTETAGPHTVSHPDYPDELAGTLGPVMPGMEHRVIDPDSGIEVVPGALGELLVRGDALMAGFVKKEREVCFDAAGWYHTGDLCSYRGEHIFFHGRLDDMIKTSGANVSPREVEAALSVLPGIEQAIVVSVPDPQRVSIVGAIVVAHPGADLVEAGIRRALKTTLSAYKIPRVIKIIEPAELPILSSTKIDRRLLVRMLIDAVRQD
jgi:acyl-CoA synthetase (AMP-forming)/AMP-acid ligase II